MTVVVPAGLPMLEAARWVGGSCWLELHVHEVLTAVLAAEGPPDELRAALWRVRANRAEVAEAWHRRLPELREFPRETFVLPPAGVPDDGVGGAGSPDAAAVGAWLTRLSARYDDHAAVAVGPADGPVAATLSWARAVLLRDLEAIRTGSVLRPDPSR